MKTNQINKVNEGKSKKTEKSEKITKNAKNSVAKALSPQQEIDKALLEVKTFPIHEGIWRYFNRMKGEGFILPNDGGRDIYVSSFGSDYKTGEAVNYIEVCDGAIPTETGIVKFVRENTPIRSDGEKKSIIFVIITPDDDSIQKDVRAENLHFDLPLDGLQEGDKVEFVANKEGIIVALQKK